MKKCYVKAYFDWIEQTAALSDAERGRLFIAVLEYARSGLDPKLDGREGILFPVFKATIDRDNKTSETNATNGALGGRGHKAAQSEAKRKKAKQSEQKATKEKEKEKEEDEDNNIPPIAPPFADLRLQEAFDRWLQYKAERKETYQPVGLQSLITQIGKKAEQYGTDAVAELIDNCMAAGWKGIIFDRLKNSGKEWDFRDL